jgi:hypothetical protein
MACRDRADDDTKQHPVRIRKHTLTTSARHRLDLIAYRARPQLTLDYSGYHHWPKQGHVVVHVAIGAMSVDERAIKSTIRFAK